MIPELGLFSLILAFFFAIIQGTLPLVGVWKNNATLSNFAVPAARAQFVFIALAFVCLGYSFYANDFSVLYVASNSNSHLPLVYRLAAVWGGHEGSMLLWVSILAVWTMAVTMFAKGLPTSFRIRLIAVMGLVSVGFLAFIIFTSNPFERLIPAAVDGRDLNPLLQDPGMVFHPPVLYMGYVGFSVAFAFAIAALLDGRLDITWARWTRPWTTVAWVFLTLGIAFGSEWAYYELGWGGWWFWDAVENASFMPWLVGTALIHSLAVTEKRDAFKVWTVLLSICAFSLSLLGTFLVRSGVLTSVHAFATDPGRGLFILVYLVVVIGGALLLFALRAPTVGLGERFDVVSRESMLLANNVVLAAAAGSVLLGTMYPLLMDALGAGKISVGPPYFDAVFVAIMVPGIFLMGLGPLAKWKKASLPEIGTRLRVAAVISVVSALLVPSVMGKLTLMAAVGVFLGIWVMSTSLILLVNRLKTRQTAVPNLIENLKGIPLAFYGMLLAHIGIGVFVLGVTLVKGYESEQDLRMEVNDVAHIGNLAFRFEGAKEVAGPNYLSSLGKFIVTSNSKEVAVLHPEKRFYPVQGAMMTEADIEPGVLEDIYVSLGEPLENGAWSVRIYIKPFVRWIWAGCILMALGGILALMDRRYRIVNKKETREAQEGFEA
ncbi:MAG TPA: heme lyase CcmF/NrfE family subunit [Methylotenera sp.]|nr:heme lyase CcmF/NrfE family subunit [Methylotenera sp.]HPV44334.1 heme lyase CcmF/NrfE family subunit [Methylotenera sp.]